ALCIVSVILFLASLVWLDSAYYCYLGLCRQEEIAEAQPKPVTAPLPEIKEDAATVGPQMPEAPWEVTVQPTRPPRARKIAAKKGNRKKPLAAAWPEADVTEEHDIARGRAHDLPNLMTLGRPPPPGP